MRRLFALIGFTYLIVLTVAVFLSDKILIMCLVINIILFIISVLIKDVRKNKVFPIALFTSLSAFTIYIFNFKVNILPIRELCDKDVSISGVICDIPYSKNGRYYYTLEVDKIVGTDSNRKFKLNLSCSSALDADIYDRFTGNIHTFIPNYGSEFYSQSYSISKGIYLSAFLYDYQPVEIEEITKKPLNYYTLNFRKKMISSIKSILPELHASIASGVLLGEKYDIPEDIKENFIKIGVYHLLTVSGIHIVLLSEILLSGFRKVGIKKNIGTLLTIIFIIFFTSINCFTPSITRASIMLIVYLIGNLIGRKPDSINSLGLSVFLMSVANPNIGGDIRIWLSSLSVLGVIVFQKRIEDFINSIKLFLLNDNKISKYIIKSVSLTLSVMIATFPANVMFFKRISLVAPLSNVLMMFPTTIMILLTFASSVFYLLGFPKGLIMPVCAILKLIINYLVTVGEYISKIPFDCISIEYKFMYLWVASVLILVGLSFIIGDIKKQLKFVSLLSLDILLIGVISHNLLMRNIIRLSILDVGNGCSLVLSKNGRNAILSCGGEEYYSRSIVEYLESINASSIDLLLAPYNDDESGLFFKDVQEKYKQNSVILSESTIAEGSFDIEPIRFNNKVDIKIWNNVNISTSNIEGKPWVFAKIDDINILICPSGGNVRKIPYEWRNCDIFIAGDLPINCDLISPIYNVLSENKKSCQINYKKLSDKALNNYVTSGCGTINIDIKVPRTIAIGRNI